MIKKKKRMHIKEEYKLPSITFVDFVCSDVIKASGFVCPPEWGPDPIDCPPHIYSPGISDSESLSPCSVVS